MQFSSFKTLLAATKEPCLRGQVLRFLIVGGMGTVIDLVAYMALMAWVGCTPSWAKRWSFILGSVWAFFMHKHYTFRQKGRCKKQLIGFMGVYAIGWLVNSYAHDAVLGAWHMRSLAYVVGTALSTVTHFVLQKYFVFTGPKHHDKA